MFRILTTMPRSREQTDARFRAALAQALATAAEFTPGILVTVIEAKLASSQTSASATLSVFPVDRQAEVMRLLQESRYGIKDALASSLRLRRIPVIYWKFDTTLSEISKLDDTLAELKQRGEL